MATSSSSTKQKKAFSFKKRDNPVDEVFIIDDDDDDFKESKNPFSSTTADCDAVTQLCIPPPTEKLQGKVPSTKAHKKRSTAASATAKQSSSFTGNLDGDNVGTSKRQQRLMSVSEEIDERSRVDIHKQEIEEVLLDEQENCDVVDILGKRPPVAGSTDGKEAWKSLMGTMQKNQAEVVRSGSKKGKPPATKRGLAQSPKPKTVAAYHDKIKADKIQSPVKKNARLGSGDIAAATSCALKEFKNGTRLESDSLKMTPNQYFIPQSDEMAVVHMKEIVMKPPAPTTIAPVFLPPAERKALQKTSKSDSSHLLDSIINSDSDSQSQTNLPEDPTHFNGNAVILNTHQPDKDPYEGNKTKVCPFYKKLPGVPFCVDAFNYGLIPGMEVYFLSHFHSDHYIGISKRFCKTIICSYPTGNLVRMKLYVEEKCIRKLRMNKPYIVCDSEVTMVDANHCPGSVMFVFRFKTGAVTLHTGDFRYTPNMLTLPCLSGLRIDNLYLDTTYCSPQYDFPTQNESVANAVAHVKRHLEHRPQTLIICGTYLIGKERVFFTLAEAIGSKVYGPYDKRKIINALENKKFSSLLSADENSTQVHVVPMFSINPKNLQDYLAKYPQYTNIIGIKPSGWQFSSCGSGCSVKTHYNGTVTLLRVPYSEHSSFSELKEFVTSLKPKRVQPTVNVGNPKKRGEMMQHIESWISS